MFATASAWVALMLVRVSFYGLERLRFPDIVPPLWVNAIQGLALWPCVIAGVYLTLRTWQHSSAVSAVAVAVATSWVVSVLAGFGYVLGALFDPGEAALSIWLDAARPTAARSWYCWLSVILEFNALYSTCLLAVLGIVGFRMLTHEHLTRLNAEAGVARNRLRVLRAQLNPHFLFNALNSIASLSDTHPRAAQRMVVQLSELLRRTLRASECEEHRLSEELAYSETYLRIQQLRLPSRLRWHLHTDPRCSSARVPSLILLPLVENAVIHGLRGGVHVVEIDIDVTCPDSRVVMTVTNSCHPSPMIQDAHTGLGLRNVRERLEILYGREAMLFTRFTTANRFHAAIHLPTPRCPVQMHEPQESQCAS